MAGRHADMVSVNPRLRAGTVTPLMLADATAERIGQKIAWVRAAAEAAGRADDAVELQTNFLCRIETSSSRAREAVSSPAARSGHRPAAGGSPAVLAGSVDQCVEALRVSRERFGASYVNVGGDVEAPPSRGVWAAAEPTYAGSCNSTSQRIPQRGPHYWYASYCNRGMSLPVASFTLIPADPAGAGRGRMGAQGGTVLVRGT